MRLFVFHRALILKDIFKHTHTPTPHPTPHIQSVTHGHWNNIDTNIQMMEYSTICILLHTNYRFQWKDDVFSPDEVRATSDESLTHLRVQNEQFLEEKGFILSDTEKEV